MAEYELNPREYFRIAKKRWRVIVITMLALPAIVFVLAKEPPPEYSAVSTIKIEVVTTPTGILMQALTFGRGDTLETELNVITSQPVLAQAAVTLGMLTKTEANLDAETSKKKAKVIADLRKRIEVKKRGATNIVDITATGKTTAEAVALANAVADAYKQIASQKYTRRVRETRMFIEKQVEAARTQLEKAEAAVKQFKIDNFGKISLSDNDANTLLAEIEQLDDRLSTIDLQVEQLKKAKELKGGSRLDFISGMGESPTIDRLNSEIISAQLKKQELLQVYTEQAPEVQLVQQKIESLLDNLINEFSAVANRLHQRRENLVERLRALPENDTELARLNRDLDVREKVFASLEQMLKEAEIRETEAEKIQTVTILERATGAYLVNVSTKWVKMGAAWAVGLILGIFSAIVLETFDTTITDIEDMETFIEANVVGIIPHVEETEAEKASFEILAGKEALETGYINCLIAQLLPKSRCAEAYRALRTGLEFMQVGSRSARVIMVTSAIAQEGKTVTAANLALVCAQSGKKTLLIEGDLRKSSLHKCLGLDRRPGIADLVTGGERLENCVRTFADITLGTLSVVQEERTQGLDNLHVMTSGNVVVSPVQILGSERFAQILERLARQYDYVIIDTPPVLPVADACLIAPQVEAVLFVYKVGMTVRNALRRAKTQVDRVRRKDSVVGIVLNDLTNKIAGLSEEIRYSYYAYEIEEPSRLDWLWKVYRRKKKRPTVTENAGDAVVASLSDGQDTTENQDS